MKGVRILCGGELSVQIRGSNGCSTFGFYIVGQ